jgi:uncharacterized protein (DUF488 family)
MAKQIYTFGYEGLSIERFVDRLIDAGVKLVIDVRAVPLSRKRGFSKTALQKELAEAGIDYAHSSAMGCPKSVRERYKQDGNWTAYTAGFLKYLASQEDQLMEVAALIKSRPACLICFEADHRFCHRSFIAQAVSTRIGAPITHLTDQTARVGRLAQAAA